MSMRLLVVRLLFVGLLLAGLPLARSVAQTPTPLADWQFSAGETLASLAGPIPEWRAIIGGGVETQPDYPGAKHYLVGPSAIIDIRYSDIAFLSDGEGLGVNLLHGDGYRAGIAIAYDLGRNHNADHRLDGLPNIDPAPEPKLFAQYFFKFVVFTADLRRAIGGYNGVVGDVGAYVPIPLASNAFLFLGPNVTFANSVYSKNLFGIDETESKSSGLPTFDAGSGLNNASFGVTLDYFFTEHWLLNADAAFSRLLGNLARSPLTETPTQLTLAVNIGYRF
jgi:outer membrane scaffolding protein for murein synthesis (MipA/OmpV family)